MFNLMKFLEEITGTDKIRSNLKKCQKDLSLVTKLAEKLQFENKMLFETRATIKSENNNLKAKLKLIEKIKEDLNATIDELKKKLTGKNNDDFIEPKERYYETKYPSTIIKYTGRYDYRTKQKVKTDLRTFFANPEHDQMLKDLLNNQIRVKDSDSNDTKIQKIQSWTVQNLAYLSDSFTSSLEEYWQLPYETLASKKGDCEDGAIFMANLALASGIPYWRVRVSAGDVEYEGKTAGHAWMNYCRETDDKFVIVDWCYYPDYNTPMKSKPYWRDVKWYKTIWFSFNQRRSFSTKDSMIMDPEEFKKFVVEMKK